MNVVNAGNEGILIKQGAAMGQICKIEFSENKFEEGILNFVPLDFSEVKKLAIKRRQMYAN